MLRTFDRRLVCDRCEGMLIELDDFADALNTTDPIEVHDDGPAARKCPRCLRSMRGCRLSIGKLDFEHVLACCPDDGIWFGERSLETILARVGRHHHRGGGGNPEQGVSSLYTKLRQPRSRPTPPAIPISGLRKRRLACPVCAGDLELVGERWACAHCAGTFVENFALESMVSEIRQAPWHVPTTVAGSAGALSCPVCAGTMHTDTIQQVAVDRCGDHGVWFDALDLGAALRHAGGVDQPRGVTAWLRRLFA